jgi:hypothetical protein
LAEKIEFRDEIMYIYNNYGSNPEILRPDVYSDITKKVYFDKIIEGNRSYESKFIDLGK